MNPLLRMSNDELIDTTQKSELDYDIRIEASKEYLRRKGVISDGEEGRLQCSDG
ncbi:hypothetical protein D3C75_1294520 [compost metagenome]